MANLAMTSKLPDQTALAGGTSADQFPGQTEVVTDPDMLVHGLTIRQWSEDWLKALATPDAARRLVVRVLGILAIVGLLNGPSPSAGAAPDTPTTPPPPPPQTLTPEAWHKSMVRKPAPTAGCYTSSYPSTDWQKVPCSTTAPQVPHPVNGYLSKVPGSISSATGSFYSVTDANCELNVPLNVTGVTCTSSPTTSGTLNAFSLQLNTNGYLTGLCPNNLECSGQQQYIYDNNGSSIYVYIQYWLVGYPNPNNSPNPCPTAEFDKTGNHWAWYGGHDGAHGCFVDGYMTPVHKPDNPNLTITALPALILTGNNSAAQQSAVLETQAGPAELAIAADFGDPLGIGSSWNTSEFNVLGLSDSQAVFNVGAAIVVQLDATVDNGAAALPQCVPGKFSGETNNLTVIGCCPVQFGPNGPGTEAVNRVLITESNALIPPISMCSCPAGSSWDPSNEACTMPVSNNPRCFSGLGGDEIFCPRLDRCVTKAEYKAECLFHKPTPP